MNIYIYIHMNIYIYIYDNMILFIWIVVGLADWPDICPEPGPPKKGPRAGIWKSKNHGLGRLFLSLELSFSTLGLPQNRPPPKICWLIG